MGGIKGLLKGLSPILMETHQKSLTCAFSRVLAESCLEKCENGAFEVIV